MIAAVMLAFPVFASATTNSNYIGFLGTINKPHFEYGFYVNHNYDAHVFYFDVDKPGNYIIQAFGFLPVYDDPDLNNGGNFYMELFSEWDECIATDYDYNGCGTASFINVHLDENEEYSLLMGFEDDTYTCRLLITYADALQVDTSPITNYYDIDSLFLYGNQESLVLDFVFTEDNILKAQVRLLDIYSGVTPFDPTDVDALVEVDNDYDVNFLLINPTQFDPQDYDDYPFQYELPTGVIRPILPGHYFLVVYFDPADDVEIIDYEIHVTFTLERA